VNKSQQVSNGLDFQDMLGLDTSLSDAAPDEVSYIVFRLLGLFCVCFRGISFLAFSSLLESQDILSFFGLVLADHLDPSLSRWTRL
jgi:hypothetical protein